MKFLLRAVVVLVAIGSHGAAAWDPFNIFGSVQDKMNQVADRLSGDLRDAFLQVENHFMQDLLPPIIDKVDAVASGLIAQVDEDVQKTVDHVKNSINEMIETAGNEIMVLEDHTVEEVIILLNSVFAGVNQITETLYTDVNLLLDKVSSIIKELDCSIEGVSGSWLATIRAVADDGLIPNPFDKCRKEQNLGFKRVSSLDNYSLYKFFKCRLLEKITVKTSVVDVLGYYGEGQRTAAQMRCISRMSPAGTSFYTQEFIQWGEWYNNWNWQGVGLSLSDVLKVSNGSPVAKLLRVTKPTNDRVSVAASSDACSTGSMIDCVNEAMRILQQAEGEMQTFKQTMTLLVDGATSTAQKALDNSNSAVAQATLAKSTSDSALKASQDATAVANSALSAAASAVESVKPKPLTYTTFSGRDTIFPGASTFKCPEGYSMVGIEFGHDYGYDWWSEEVRVICA